MHVHIQTEIQQELYRLDGVEFKSDSGTYEVCRAILLLAKAVAALVPAVPAVPPSRGARRHKQTRK